VERKDWRSHTGDGKRVTTTKQNSFLKLQTICYVCGKVTSGKTIYIGNGLHRHVECEPGSSRWLKSPISKKVVFVIAFLHLNQVNKAKIPPQRVIPVQGNLLGLL